MTEPTPIIRLEGISKAFGAVQANRDITLDIQAGRILALLGENGAGKSTLMSILAGQIRPDSGRILLRGEPVVFTSTEQAIEAGIGMVYQHFKLVEAMSVAENVVLGQPGPFWLGRRAMHARVAALASDYGIMVRPGARVADLSMGEKQQVEILRLLYRQSTVLIFDEPTAVLTPTEATALFAAMRRMTALGKAVVFISHKLEEVLAAAESIAILRRGEVIDRMAATEVPSTAELARRMVGRPVLLQVERAAVPCRQTVLQVAGLVGDGLRGVDFEVRQGEILGLVGVAGNGQKPLVETICGLRRPSVGCVRILGEEWGSFFARRDREKGLSYVPEDRQGLATCPGLDLLDNFLLTTRAGFCRGGWLQRHRAAAAAGRLLEAFDVRPPELGALARQQPAETGAGAGVLSPAAPDRGRAADPGAGHCRHRRYLAAAARSPGRGGHRARHRRPERGAGPVGPYRGAVQRRPGRDGRPGRWRGDRTDPATDGGCAAAPGVTIRTKRGGL
jgi:simple sugar transport system ATP-binding protein